MGVSQIPRVPWCQRSPSVLWPLVEHGAGPSSTVPMLPIEEEPNCRKGSKTDPTAETSPSHPSHSLHRPQTAHSLFPSGTESTLQPCHYDNNGSGQQTATGKPFVQLCPVGMAAC
ncbi:hypothetical protein AAFF_G00148540 [Aldrovandia affinis]|uniref:Uncharacterized protein n=1 Tax=Aldrovandia affinis TaxID=143900 RepID=A0AAD7RPJ0_9TELE|nr:hypothetical protein AAFF_G00148540 [Aldrovandia affinis]